MNNDLRYELARWALVIAVTALAFVAVLRLFIVGFL
jgi:hypothetical protein